MKFIFLNGPARSGKDYAAEYLSSKFENVITLKFATALYESVPRMFGLSDSVWADMYENEKEVPSPALQGMSPRQAMIWLSEDVMKPHFGQDFFGQAMITSVNTLVKEGMADESTVFVASDSGFLVEAVPVMDHFGIDRCMRIELLREGCSFQGDSRSYWHHPGLRSHPVCNLGDESFHAYLDQIISTFID